MKEMIVVIGLCLLGVLIATLILGSGGIMGAVKDLFVEQVQFLAD